MAVKIPQLACSHPVGGTCSERIDTATTDATVTVPEGRYWLDPFQFGAPNDLADVFADLVDASAATVTGFTATYTTSAAPAYLIYLAATAGDATLAMTHAANTTAGRELVSALGFDPCADSLNVASGSPRTSLHGIAAWYPDRGEAGSIDETWEGFGSVLRTVGGAVYTADLGDPLPKRLVSFRGLTGEYSLARPLGSFAPTYFGFQEIMWPALARGEFVRYYADRSATKTHITSAMTATATTMAVAERTGFSAAQHVCVDGEWMIVVSGTGSGAGTLTMRRRHPVAHASGSPVSADFVGTYTLDDGSGDVSRRGFFPNRRAPNQDRWDFDIGLLRAVI